MSALTLWLVICVAGLGTFALRASSIALMGRAAMPPLIARGLAFVPPAVLAALVFPGMAKLDGAILLAPDNPRLIAGALALAVAWVSKSMLATLVVGMGALWLLQAWL